jgi:hypothetical protein
VKRPGFRGVSKTGEWSQEDILEKSRQIDKPGWPTGNGTTRLMDWLNEAADSSGTIAGKKLVDPADQAYADKILKLIQNEGCVIENKVMQVSIPKPGTSGNPVFELFDW